MADSRQVPDALDPALDAPAQHTSGITSRLVLEYVERAGGRSAVDAVLARCGAEDREAWLRDESSWLPYDLKVALFHAAAETLDDPEVMRHIGECALELNVGQGLTIALRALGSPRLVYQNIVRANAKFSRSHSMELLELRSDFARIRFVNLIGVEFEPLDCEYNQGLLACTPGLFGLPPARVAHPECVGDGDPACVYDVSWDPKGDWVRVAVGSGVVSAGALAGAALLAPAALPVAAGVTVAAAGATAWRVLRIRRARWRELQLEARGQADVTERLFASMQDLVSELRVDEVLAKITANAEAAVTGKQFALLLEEDGQLRAAAPAGLPERATAAIEAWASSSGRLGETALLVDDCAAVPGLAALTGDADRPLHSLCAAPLLYRGRRLGVLVAFAPHARTFLPRDVDLVQWYASQAAIALANARAHAAQEALASRDPLTGLLNHREFHQTLERELQRARRSDRPVSVTLFDLDGFKAVNDQHGHARGDVALAAVADAIDGASRAGDLVFRIGGDEFAVLLPDTESADAGVAALRTCEALAAGGEAVTASFGVATWPDDGGSKEVLLAEADDRMYAMKADPAARDEAGAAAAVLSDVLTTLAPETYEHSLRVADRAEAAGRRMGMGTSERRRMRNAAMLHDLGPRVISAVPALAHLEPIVRAVHERWDGSGPDGLRGETIPRAARVIAACEAFDAMTAEELRGRAGTQLDPAVVDALLATGVCQSVEHPPGKDSHAPSGQDGGAVHRGAHPPRLPRAGGEAS